MNKVNYILRTNDRNNQSYKGFQWPRTGIVSAPDWIDNSECGHGLHGFLNGEGDSSLARWHSNTLWLVCKVTSKIIDLDGEVKFESCEVIYCGDRLTATNMIYDLCGNHAVIGGSCVSGYGGTSTSGDCGTSISGEYGKSTSGNHGASISGNHSISTSGNHGTATSGNYGILSIKWHDGNRNRTSIGYIGENGLLADTPYKLDDNGQFIETSLQ